MSSVAIIGDIDVVSGFRIILIGKLVLVYYQ